MEVLWDIAIIVVVGGTGAMVGYKIGEQEGFLKGQDMERRYYFRKTSRQTQLRGTPEQERGSDDTG